MTAAWRPQGDATYEVDIVTAIAEMLDDLGISEWQDTGVYASAGGPITTIRSVPDTPDRALVTLSSYAVTPAMGWDDTVTGIQVRTRCPGQDPRPVDLLDGLVYRALHGLAGTVLGGHRVSKLALQSSASLGQDEHKRWARSSNYYLHGPRN